MPPGSVGARSRVRRSGPSFWVGSPAPACSEAPASVIFAQKPDLRIHEVTQ